MTKTSKAAARKAEQERAMKLESVWSAIRGGAAYGVTVTFTTERARQSFAREFEARGGWDTTGVDSVYTETRDMAETIQNVVAEAEFGSEMREELYLVGA